MPSINLQGLGRLQVRYGGNWPEPTIPYYRTGEKNRRDAKTVARPLTNTIALRRLKSYPALVFEWNRAA